MHNMNGSCTWRMFCAENVERTFTSFHISNFFGEKI